MNCAIKTLKGQAVVPYLNQIKNLRKEIFRQYPYLMQTTEEHEENYLKLFVTDPTAIMLIATEKANLLGIMTGIGLISDTGMMGQYKDIFIQLFAEKDLNAKEFYYCGEILQASNDPVVTTEVLTKLLAAEEQEAKKLGYKHLCFLKMQDNEAHPLKPQNYQDKEPVGEHGFFETSIVFQYSWPTIQFDESVKEQEHKLTFWIKKID